MGDLLLMSKRELTRHQIVQQLLEKRLTQPAAADLLGLSVRHIKRLARAYRHEGAAALISKRRGQPSNNQLPRHLKAQASGLIRAHYFDFGPTVAHEKVIESHGLTLSRESVRQLMIADGVWQPKRAPSPVIHQMRQRRACCGELVQIDGSPHDWFEGRAPQCTLLVFIDDATGRLMQLLFVEAETTFAYFEALRHYFAQPGKPVALYSDRFGVFRVNMPNPLTGSGLTQFGRAMKELEIERSLRQYTASERKSGTSQPNIARSISQRTASATDLRHPRGQCVSARVYPFVQSPVCGRAQKRA